MTQIKLFKRIFENDAGENTFFPQMLVERTMKCFGDHQEHSSLVLTCKAFLESEKYCGGKAAISIARSKMDFRSSLAPACSIFFLIKD